MKNRKGAADMTKIRKIFESSPKNREAEGAEFVALGLIWMLMDGMMPIGIVFMAIGIGDMARGRKEKKNRG